MNFTNTNSPTPVRAVFVDLDGTLLNSKQTISDCTIRVLRALKSKYQDKVAFVVATGRPFDYVLQQIQRSSLTVDYIISSNGCRVHRGKDLSVLSAHSLPPETVERLFHVNVEKETRKAPDMALALSGDVSKVVSMATSIFRGSEWKTNYLIETMGDIYPANMQPSLLPDDVLECLTITNPLSPTTRREMGDMGVIGQRMRTYFQDVHMAFFYGPNENLLHAEQTLLHDPLLEDSVDFAFSLPNIIDIFPKNIDKSSALREVLAELGLSPADAVAFGDGLNDLTMLSIVGRGFVMQNALPRLKAQLPHHEVIGSNNEDGVAKKLCELFDLQVPVDEGQ